jgi:porin
MKNISSRFLAPVFATALGLLLATFVVPVQAASVPEKSGTDMEAVFSDWWNGKKFTGDWLGARDVLEDRGIKFGGSWKLAYFGVADSQNGSGGFYGQDLVFNSSVDFSKLLGLEAIEGLEGFIEGRWRENRPNMGDPNELVEASSMFNPSPWWSGVGWRMVTFGAEYQTPELFGIDELLTLKGGWLRPQREFIDQPLSKLFLNNAINSSKGIGGNIPFSSSFSTWGGTLTVKPADWHYTRAGLFMAYPGGTSFNNNGLMFQGSSNSSLNDLFFMIETGFTPKIGAAKLPGKYAFGSYYYGEDNKTFGRSKYGFYWQADQMVYREPSLGDKLSDQGLRMFSLFTYAPTYNGTYPFYAQGGLVYEGLIPKRAKDELYGGLGVGTYDQTNIKNADRDYTMVLEGGYKLRVNGWSFVSPYIQYLIQPDGSRDVANATILGVQTGITF